MLAQKDINGLAMQQAKQLYDAAFVRAKQLEEKAEKWTGEGYELAKDYTKGFYAKAQEYYEGKDGELEALEKDNLERMKVLAKEIGQRSTTSNASIQESLTRQRNDFEREQMNLNKTTLDILKRQQSYATQQERYNSELFQLTHDLTEEVNKRVEREKEASLQRSDILNQVVRWGSISQEEGKENKRFTIEQIARATKSARELEQGLRKEVQATEQKIADIETKFTNIKNEYVRNEDVENLVKRYSVQYGVH